MDISSADSSGAEGDAEDFDEAEESEMFQRHKTRQQERRRQCHMQSGWNGKLAHGKEGKAGKNGGKRPAKPSRQSQGEEILEIPKGTGQWYQGQCWRCVSATKRGNAPGRGKRVSWRRKKRQKLVKKNTPEGSGQWEALMRSREVWRQSEL